jgi:hypothetical protein
METMENLRERLETLEAAMFRNSQPRLLAIGGALFVCMLVSIQGDAHSGTPTVSVPGTSDPWLAGMPPGATASLRDMAPAQSPVEIVSPSIIPGTVLHFSAEGMVSNGTCSLPNCPTNGPDGGETPGRPFFVHDAGAENGIADVLTPINSLVGVFLGPKQPDRTSAPDPLDFRTPADRNYLTLSPGLKQVFFIGDGLTDSGQAQQVIVPAGATRLFLGTMDGCCWLDNLGSFTVIVKVIHQRNRVVVEADEFFNATGIYAFPGESFLIRAQGVVDISTLNGGYQTGPDGTIVTTPPSDSGAFEFFRDRAGPLDTNPVRASRKSFLPLTDALPGHLPGAPYGALVAGFSPLASPSSFADFPHGFALIGTRGIAQAPNSGGYLFLGVNDFNNPGGDNAGAFRVRIFSFD